MKEYSESILVVDDEKLQREIIRDILNYEGYPVTIAGSGQEALEFLKQSSVALVITDLKMPEMDGIELLGKVKEISPETSVIVVTAYGSVESAVEAMKKGAFHYLTKPFGKEELLLTVQRALENRSLLRENRLLRKELEERYQFHNLIGSSPRMQEVFKIIEKVAPSDSTVLIYGESGTGKELVARAIHFYSKRKNHAFLAINCAAIPDTLLESEMFGHEKGSFSGAYTQKKGIFEEAHQGTLFLDEIGDLNISLQAKLLRVLQDGEIKRVGGNKVITVDVRVIAATNKNLEEEMQEGRFRQDLYYRLNVVPIFIPSLRERKEDISLLVDFFIKKYGKKFGKTIEKITPDAMDRLLDYSWPGNVRELESVIERTVLLNEDGIIRASDLPQKLSVPKSQNIGLDLTIPDEGISLSEVERSLIENALIKSNWSIKRASELLGITYKTLQYRIQKFHLKRENSLKG
jgi:DNA-binding NtrC family response regulator